jgi:hypothetical protein
MLVALLAVVRAWALVVLAPEGNVGVLDTSSEYLAGVYEAPAGGENATTTAELE